MSMTEQDATHSLFSERCFIIQPFEPNFIERCDAYFKPAIQEAGLSPYRVDEHYEPDQLLRINVIYKEIQNALVCLADISMNNPNVWYEFGFADGKEIPVVLICDDKLRKNLPFDVNQRTVYFYRSDSNDGLLELRNEITKRIRSTAKEAIKKKKRVDSERISRIEDFRAERVKTIKDQEPELPVKLPSGVPTVAFHIIPAHGFFEEEQIDFDGVNPHELQAPVSGSRRTNMDGFCWHNLEERNGEYAQLFQQTGIMEYVETFGIPNLASRQQQKILPSLSITKRLIWALCCYAENLRKLDFGRSPWHLFLGLSLLNVRDYFWAPPHEAWFGLVPADRSDLVLPLESKKMSSEADATATLYPLLNKLWRAFNYKKCPYDENELRGLMNMG